MNGVLELRDLVRVHGAGPAQVRAGRRLAVGGARRAGRGHGPSGSGKTTLLTLAGGLDS
jgi:putative ABC transport system ATP-binding protein